VRVRGLKPLGVSDSYQYIQSHPVRVRGLKHKPPRVFLSTYQVAPRAGAWIETNWKGGRIIVSGVAPRAGAWIETIIEIG